LLIRGKEQGLLSKSGSPEISRRQIRQHDLNLRTNKCTGIPPFTYDWVLLLGSRNQNLGSCNPEVST
jgi:hypothetical protein